MRRGLRAALAGGILAATLAGCTSFAPVYGDRTGGDMASARFNFAAPDSRVEQIILNRLKLSFPEPALPSDPTLDIAAAVSAPQNSMSDAYAVARPVNVRVEATVTIRRNNETVFEARRFADTAYQGGKLTPVDLASGEGASEVAARATAEALRAAILAGYRP